VPQSYPEAAKWYGLAAKRGDAGAGTVLERIRSVQAGQTAQSQRLEVRSSGLPSMGRLEPAMFRFSSPMIEQRTIHIGPAPSAGFHMMTAHHFGRR
jgi:TPR repeat protein